MKQTGFRILFLFLLGFTQVQAQRSIMDELSIPFLEKLIQTAKENYPRQKALTMQVGIAQNNLNRERLSWLDGLGVYYLYLPPAAAVTGTPVSKTNNGFQFGFSFNVGSLLGKPAQINAAKGNVNVARFQREEFELSIVADVKQRYYNYIKQLTLLKQQTQLTQDAQSALTSVRSKFERSQDTFDNLTKALVFYNQQNQELINIETELLTAKANLEELLNTKLEDIK